MRPVLIENLEGRLLFSGSAYKLPTHPVAPLTVVSLGKGAANTGDNVQVVFSDGAGYSIKETASSARPVKVEVPIYFNPTTILPAAGKLTVSVVDNGVVTQLPGILRVLALPAAKGPPGTETFGFVESEFGALTSAENQLLPTITDPDTQTAVQAEIDAVRADLAEHLPLADVESRSADSANFFRGNASRALSQAATIASTDSAMAFRRERTLAWPSVG